MDNISCAFNVCLQWPTLFCIKIMYVCTGFPKKVININFAVKSLFNKAKKNYQRLTTKSNFVNNIFNLLQTGTLLLQYTASNASENPRPCTQLFSRQSVPPPLRRLFRAFKFLWDFAQALASNIDQILNSIGLRSGEYGGHSADVKSGKFALRHFCVSFALWTAAESC